MIEDACKRWGLARAARSARAWTLALALALAFLIVVGWTAEPPAEFELAGLKPVDEVRSFAVPAVGDDDVDANFSGAAYHPLAGTLLVVDNEPNRGDRAESRDQGDLYEFDREGKLRRQVDLVGFADPEGIACLGDDPEHKGHARFVIVEERTGELCVFSLDDSDEPRTIDKKSLRATCVIRPQPNPIDDENSEPNDGLEGVAYDAASDVFFVAKEHGPRRGIYRVGWDGRTDKVAIEGLFSDAALGKDADLADLALAGGRLFVLSQTAKAVVEVALAAGGEVRPGERQPLRGRVVARFPPRGQALPLRQPEGIAVASQRRELVVVGEPRQWRRYRSPPSDR